MKQEIMKKDCIIEQLKMQIKQQMYDMKLAQLENQAIIRQCEFEKANGVKYESKNYEKKSPKKRENYH